MWLADIAAAQRVSDLYASFSEVDASRQLFADEGVRVVSALKDSFER